MNLNRRTLGQILGSAAAMTALEHSLGAQSMTYAQTTASTTPTTIGMVIFPDFIALDLIGPQELLSHLPGRTTQLLWKNREPVVSGSGIAFQPTLTFAECPRDLEFLFIPGGLSGITRAIEDPEVLDFVASRGERATYVTSVCDGALLLGAAGLLRGYRATSNWSVRDLLPLLGAEPVAERVVVDRNRITGGGVTAGIDFGFALLARFMGVDFASIAELILEYDPQPPYGTGTPALAGAELTADALALLQPAIEAARSAILRSPGYVDG